MGDDWLCIQVKNFVWVLTWGADEMNWRMWSFDGLRNSWGERKY